MIRSVHGTNHLRYYCKCADLFYFDFVDDSTFSGDNWDYMIMPSLGTGHYALKNERSALRESSVSCVKIALKFGASHEK